MKEGRETRRGKEGEGDTKSSDASSPSSLPSCLTPSLPPANERRSLQSSLKATRLLTAEQIGRGEKERKQGGRGGGEDVNNQSVGMKEGKGGVMTGMQTSLSMCEGAEISTSLKPIVFVFDITVE